MDHDYSRTGADAGVEHVDVVVIGAGQAGLAAAYHLRRLGFVPLVDPADPSVHGGAQSGPGTQSEPEAGTFVVLDADDGPGGAWQHRWRTLTLGGTNRIHSLPGTPLGDVDEDEPAADAVPRYFARYEREHDLRVRRPVHVIAVRDADVGGAEPDLLVETDTGSYRAAAVISGTGTWSKPFWPHYPGLETFTGRQVHSHDFGGGSDFAGQRVVVVGGGISAIQHLMEIAPVATTLWVTRREPTWREGPFDAHAGRAAVALVEERARAGLPPQSVVSVTGLPVTTDVRAARAAGVVQRFPMFTGVTHGTVQWSPPSALGDSGIPPGAHVDEHRVHWDADAILWATGFRSALDHFAPLRLRERGGGLLMDGTTVVRDPRIQLVGYGPSASTIGANRAGRTAVRGALATIRLRRPGLPG